MPDDRNQPNPEERSLRAPTADDRNVAGGKNDRAGGGGAPDHGAGDPGGTLGTGGTLRDHDQ